MSLLVVPRSNVFFSVSCGSAFIKRGHGAGGGWGRVFDIRPLRSGSGEGGPELLVRHGRGLTREHVTRQCVCVSLSQPQNTGVILPPAAVVPAAAARAYGRPASPGGGLASLLCRPGLPGGAAGARWQLLEAAGTVLSSHVPSFPHYDPEWNRCSEHSVLMWILNV